MKLEEITDEWKKDSKIDNTDLANESLKIPTLHAKYIEMYSKENLSLTKMEQEYKKLLKLKTDYYTGKMADEDRKELGWPEFDFRVLKADKEPWLDADEDLSNALLKIGLQNEKVETLRDIIKSLHSRTFVIRNAIEFLKWSAGV